MSDLNKQQIANLTVYIVRQILWDPELLRAVAREQALGWTLREYNDVLGEEEEYEEAI